MLLEEIESKYKEKFGTVDNLQDRYEVLQECLEELFILLNIYREYVRLYGVEEEKINAEFHQRYAATKNVGI